MPGTRTREEVGVGVLAEPAVAPGGNSVKSAIEGSFGGWAGEEDEIVGSTGGRGESSVGGRGEEADDTNFVVGVTEKNRLGGGGFSGSELVKGGRRYSWGRGMAVLTTWTKFPARLLAS